MDGGGPDFAVVLAASGLTVEVRPDQSILEAVLAVLPDTPWGCREGYCGACLTAVLAGAVDHRDQYLTDPERAGGEVMLICVSRSGGPRLVLDL
jgi:ferredoxin